MATTPHLGATLLEQSQSQKEITINEALSRLDALLNSGAIDKDLATPPGSPSAGDVYIVAAGATGAWSGKTGQIAYFDQVWRFIVPRTGLVLWVCDESKQYVCTGAGWAVIVSGMGLSTYDPANIAQQMVGTSATQTLTNKTLATPTLTLKQSSAPTPTAEGEIQWDTDDDRIVVGDGTGQKIFYPQSSTTFTPTLEGVTTAGTGTYSVRVGRYVRTGAMVYYSIRLTWSAHTGTGAMRIAGLPFTTQGDASVNVYQNGVQVGAGLQIAGLAIDATSYIYLYANNPMGNAGLLTLDTVGELVLSCTVIV
jgi:hypothetical protein